MAGENIIPIERLQTQIFWLRDQKIMFDFDLAALYGVETKVLNQAVTRNIERFPHDFMFKLTTEEFKNFRDSDEWSQFVTSSKKHRGVRYLPRAFTEQGVAMLSGVLKSPQAVQVNIAIMRAFVQMREAMLSNKELARRIDAMEEKYDKNFAIVFDALRDLFEAPEPSDKQIGYIKQ